MTTRHARCSCGQLEAETTAEPLRVSVCHCHACQLRTGSVFGAQARSPTPGFRRRNTHFTSRGATPGRRCRRESPALTDRAPR